MCNASRGSVVVFQRCTLWGIAAAKVLLQYCTASPSSCYLVITHRLYRLLFAVWSAAHEICLSVRAPASITTASWCRSSSPSRTFASAVTGALFLDMHAPTRDDAVMSDPPCQIRCRWVIVAECTMVIAHNNDGPLSVVCDFLAGLMMTRLRARQVSWGCVEHAFHV